MKRIFRKAALCIIVFVLIASALFISTSAATNPYPSSQTISGITTIPCTYYAWQQAYDKLGVSMPNWGNAVNWYNGAKNSGYSVGSVAKPNSIAVWSGGTYGHVSYVVSVNGSKMTVNEGGMHSNNGAYNGNGIYNGNVVNSIVGQQKGNGSTKILVGFVYLTESSSQSVTFNYYENDVSSNNAIVYYKVNKPSGWSVTKIGIKVRKEGESYTSNLEHIQNTVKGNYSASTEVPITWNFKDELGFTPTHLTKYYFKFYANVDGTDYWSSEYSISTVGSHSYGSWSTTKATTCTESGTKTRKCSGCSKTETQTISALGHNFSSTYTVDKAATCTSAGSKSKHCSRCSATTSVTTIAATGHSYNAWTTVKNATCTTNGSAERKCLNCSVKDTKTISALGHDLKNEWVIDKNATCTDVGTKSHHCSRCNYICDITTISSLNHLWTDWAVTKKATTKSQGEKTRKCTRAGCNANEKITIAVLSEDGHEHNFGEWKTITEATCAIDGTTQRKCSICQQIEEKTITANGHQFSEWIVVSEATAEKDGLLERTCDACGEKDNQKIPKITNNDSSTEIKTNNTSNSKKPTITIAIIVLSVIVLALSIACIILKFKKPSVKN